MAQKVWVDGELVDNPFELSPKDLRMLQVWRRKEGDCPYCLLRVPFDRFATYLRGSKKHPKKLSAKMMECPGCHQRFRLSTLIKITDMEVEDFAHWFWENVFLYRMMERVDGDNFFARIKLWRYEDRQTFWDVYHEYKDSTNKLQVGRDRDDFKMNISLAGGEESFICANCDVVVRASDYTGRDRDYYGYLLTFGRCEKCGEEQ